MAVFEDLLSVGILVYFVVMWYSYVKKQDIKVTFEKIKEWWKNYEEDED